MSKVDARDGGHRISELSDKMTDDDTEFSAQEADELLDRIVRRTSILTVSNSPLTYEDVAERLELSARVAREMAGEDDSQ